MAVLPAWGCDHHAITYSPYRNVGKACYCDGGGLDMHTRFSTQSYSGANLDASRRSGFYVGVATLGESSTDESRILLMHDCSSRLTIAARVAVSQVPKGHIWVEGDNANNSNDSNTFGPVAAGLVEARVEAKVWPLSEMCRVKRIDPPRDRVIKMESGTQLHVSPWWLNK
eukprot:6174528-Pleurochrysis_carterae.AAC.2